MLPPLWHEAFNFFLVSHTATAHTRWVFVVAHRVCNIFCTAIKKIWPYFVCHVYAKCRALWNKTQWGHHSGCWMKSPTLSFKGLWQRRLYTWKCIHCVREEIFLQHESKFESIAPTKLVVIQGTNWHGYYLSTDAPFKVFPWLSGLKVQPLKVNESLGRHFSVSDKMRCWWNQSHLKFRLPNFYNTKKGYWYLKPLLRN